MKRCDVNKVRTEYNFTHTILKNHFGDPPKLISQKLSSMGFVPSTSPNLPRRGFLVGTGLGT